MASKRDDLRPIQVFMGTRQFIEREEPEPFGGGNKDFFAGDDAGFVRHKQRLRGSIKAVASALRGAGQPMGFVKVVQREEALAKSHRPLRALFSRAHRFALVGADAVGEMLFQVTPDALERIDRIVEQKAEAVPRMVESQKTGKLEPRVSGYRSELGGIKDIRLYEPADRVAFSADEAVAWMRQPNVVGGYIVELFKPDAELGFDAVGRLIENFRAGLERIGGGMLVRPFLPGAQTAAFGEPPVALSVQLTAGSGQRLVELPFLPGGRVAEVSTARLPAAPEGSVGRDLTPARHGALLEFLAGQSLVRAVELPPVLETAPMGALAGSREAIVPPPPDGDHPVVGIIDGGVADVEKLNAWKVGDAGLVPFSDRSEGHGTFIAGLVVAGAHFNPGLAGGIEPAGCKFFDLDFFPRRELRSRYYRDIEDLFDQLEEKVRVAKRDHGVRVFNLSFAFGRRPSNLGYSLAADRLDRLARALDVIFVVSAGNLASGTSRPPWPAQADDAVTMLAGFAGRDQGLPALSEHMLGLTVGAVNPPGIAGHAVKMPTTYTCRGPGVGGGRKPELAQYGGAEAAGNRTGLASISPEGEGVDGCGTSYAAPLTAAGVATLDQRLARQAPRETLLALPVHRAARPAELCAPKLRHVARDFVGFGLAPPADLLLSDDPHSVTLVFSERLLARQRLDFPFAWPRSLVRPDGACRGRADVTLAYTPPIDPAHREEAMRVQLEAYLHQEDLVDTATGAVEWVSRLTHDGAGLPQGMHKTEKYLITTGLKWSPIKRYHANMPQGRGNTSNWRLSLDSLVRAGTAFPAEGVHFTLLLTISDPKGAAPVREEVRLDLRNRGLALADITVAHRVRPRSR
ncbi:S8 family serine peptidase [Falsiroseomonas sp.]|uniref:S8 family serine peptidase n=1 Tax=Falsiroseomonas sp. TaxID=2870721 RepID=UPI003F6FD1AF